MTSGDPALEQMLCQALKTMLTSCIEPLSECFGPEDVEQMRATTETDQKKFLVRIMDGKVTEEGANRCTTTTAVKEGGSESPVAPIAPVSAQRMPIAPVVGQSEEKIPIPPIGDQSEQTPKVGTKNKLGGGSAVNSVQEEEKKEKVREPPIGDVMKEHEPPIGEVGAQMGWESLGSKKEKEKIVSEPVVEEAAAQKQPGGVVQLVQPEPSFKSNSPSTNFFAAFSLLLCLIPLRLV